MYIAKHMRMHTGNLYAIITLFLHKLEPHPACNDMITLKTRIAEP